MFLKSFVLSIGVIMLVLFLFASGPILVRLIVLSIIMGKLMNYCKVKGIQNESIK